MRVLITEHFCSGGLAGHPLDSGLLSEGAAMLRAIVEDVHASGEDVVVMLDERVPFELPGRVVRAIELAPAYVDLAVARWRQVHPDLPVTLDNDGHGNGADYDKVAAQRAAAQEPAHAA